MRRTAWLLGLFGAAVALHWAGHGQLAAPPLTEPGQWSAWLDARGPVTAGVALVRVAAVAGLWYVALAALVGAVLRAVGAVTLVRVADRVTIAPVRRMLAGSVSLGLAASGVLAVAAPALRVAPAAAQALPTTTSTSTTTTVAPPATVTMHRLGPTEAFQTQPAPAPAPTTQQQWTVRPGECFWTIAEQVLTPHLGRAPTDAEIVPYWRRLIDANRNELAQRDNPDLIFPGQVFAVPAP